MADQKIVVISKRPSKLGRLQVQLNQRGRLVGQQAQRLANEIRRNEQQNGGQR